MCFLRVIWEGVATLTAPCRHHLHSSLYALLLCRAHLFGSVPTRPPLLTVFPRCCTVNYSLLCLFLSSAYSCSGCSRWASVGGTVLQSVMVLHSVLFQLIVSLTAHQQLCSPLPSLLFLIRLPYFFSTLSLCVPCFFALLSCSVSLSFLSINHSPTLHFTVRTACPQPLYCFKSPCAGNLCLVQFSFLTVVSSPRNRWFSPLSGDPRGSHRDGGWCRMSGQEKGLQHCATETQPSAVPSKPNHRETRNQGQYSRVKSAFSPLGLYYNWHKCLVRLHPHGPPTKPRHSSEQEQWDILCFRPKCGCFSWMWISRTRRGIFISRVNIKGHKMGRYWR